MQFNWMLLAVWFVIPACYAADADETKAEASGETTGLWQKLGWVPGVDSTLPEPARFGVEMELGNMAQAKAWLENGLPPDFMADRIGSGLMIGAWEGNVPIMMLFHSFGADVNLENEAGEQALLLAVWKGHSAAVEWLLQHGASLNRPPGKWSALHYAAFSGKKDLAADLLAKGANIDARSPNGSTPLMMAIYDGHVSIARFLLDAGANTRLVNEWGDGAMEWAMRYNQTAIARQIDPEGFALLASQPKENWGKDTRSEAAPTELDKLLQARRHLIVRGISPTEVDRNIAALRARYARQAREDTPPRVSALEISADPDEPTRQDAQITNEPRPASPSYRLPRQNPNKIPARRP
ncbi:MAG: ankyrin repeat domain-containing protein [Betaproteobacteria bacterium]|nr:ankyrin repeat domain-containing protein [Betaproteobacteria bacterium]